jgi:hypothetical protein
VTDADVARGGVQVRGTKEALIAEAAQAAFGDLDQLLAEFDTAHGDHDTARDALLDYRSTEHRDQPGTGCPTAGSRSRSPGHGGDGAVGEDPGVHPR